MHSQQPSLRAQRRPDTRRSAAAPITAVLVALFAALATAPAGPASAASLFFLSSCTTCAQRGAGTVAGNPQGGFATVWTGSTPTQKKAALARFFQPNGDPRGADVVLSSVAPFADGDATVAAERSGFFAAAWSRKEGLNSEILVQRFRRTTLALGSPIAVSLDPPGTAQIDFAPSIAFLADGSFLVVWERYGPPFEGAPIAPPEVMARRFSFRTGKPFGPPQKVNEGLVEGSRAAVCASRSGELAVAWTSINGVFPFQPSLHGVTLRRLTPNGQPLGAEIHLAAPLAGVGGVALACSPSTFTVAWRTDLPPAAGQGIVAQRVSAAGAILGDPVLVSGTGSSQVSAPAAFQDDGGNTVVAWTGRDTTSSTVTFRRLTAAGTLGTATTVAGLSSGTSLISPGIGGIGRAGDFAVVWTARDGLLGRRFSAAGVPLSARALPAKLAAAQPDVKP